MKKIILILFVFSIAPTFLWAQSNIQIIKGMNDLLKVTRSEDFKKWTDENVILVELDFPRRKQLPANIAQQNRELQQIFGVRGYPTVWLVTPEIIKSTDPNNPSSKINFQKLGTLGYVAGGPEKWIAAANQFLKNSENNIAPKN